MLAIEPAELDGFQVVRDTRVMGEPFQVLRDAAGVTLTISESGAEMMRDQPGFNEYLLGMAEFITRNSGYKPTLAVREAGPVKILRVACIDYGYDKHNTASLYVPDAQPDIVVKAFDLDRYGGMVQFHTMNWLNAVIADSPEPSGLTSPKQYGIFKAPDSGHETIVMERMTGTVLYNAVWPIGTPYDSEKAEDLNDGVSHMVEDRLTRLIGPSWRRRLNDVTKRHLANIMVDNTTELTIDNVDEHSYSIIDQPASRLPVQIKTLLLRSIGLSR